MTDHFQSHKISTVTGVALVVANMIGTGVFTSLGFQVNDLPDPKLILILWVLGGLIALSGAFSYAMRSPHFIGLSGYYIN